MELKHLRVKRFRGIRELDWTPGGRMVCLIGAGDSTKTTILTAYDSPRVPGRARATTAAGNAGASSLSAIRSRSDTLTWA